MNVLTTEATLTHPCGHTTDFLAACTSVDHFTCPQCGLAWHIQQAPPDIYPNGHAVPGKRTTILDSQLHLPQLLTH